MSQVQDPLRKFVEQRNKNLEFFKRRFPGIFEFFTNYEMKASRLDILPESNDVDLIENNQHVYGGGANKYCRKEVSQFLNVFDYGKKVNTFKPLFSGTYKNPRYFAQRLESLYQASPINKNNFTAYTIPDFFPMVVFLGCGAGQHITFLTEQRDIFNVLIVETNMDRFAATLYSTDWESVVSPYLDRDDRTFNFSLIPNAESEQQVRDVVWNQLIEHCPVFPVMTFYYNHLGDHAFDRIIDSLNADLSVHLLSFGNYDDELNQLNNAMHNFNAGIKKLPVNNDSEIDTPICIIGSGPSLDERLNVLKSFRDKIIIISCGTALKALYSHGIKPDIHVELESDYNTYATQSLMDDKAYLSSINLIGAAQLNPLLFSLFGKKRMFFKQDSGVAELFAESEDMIPHAAPTCTNAALAFAFHFGYQNIFLFGLDFGFQDKEQHHAKNTLYYKKDAPQGLKNSVNYNENDLLTVDAANGGKVYTTHFLYASKRRVESVLGGFPDRAIYNCSNGVNISKSQWLNEDKLISLLALDYKNDKQEQLEFFFSKQDISIQIEDAKKSLQDFTLWLETTLEYIDSLLRKTDVSLERLTEICELVNQYISRSAANGKRYYYFLRGSIWHFLLLGYSHGNSFENKSAQRDFLENWRDGFRQFLQLLPNHLTTVLLKDYALNEDAWVSQSITKPDIPSLEWEYQECSINEGEIVFDHVQWKYVGFGYLDGKYVNYK